ncbi:MAG: (d)CMP kinase [Elusimicrobia bacterium]|nr:(d)CMP kinase [Elusimicrobiota bacterium]
MKKFIIAIDGPAGAGKSTIAKMVARRMGYVYIDTGAMYRALTYIAIINRVDLRSGEDLVKLAERTKIEFERVDDRIRVIIDGMDVTKEIRDEKVSECTNVVASVQGVRKILRKMQQKMGKKGGVVMEGRDIGTCVFPSAEFKFYLDASPEERAKRRYKELKQKGEKVDYGRIENSIARRDYLDKTRGINPLKQAKDALMIDSTDMTLAEVANFIVNRVKNRVKVNAREIRKQ